MFIVSPKIIYSNGTYVIKIRAENGIIYNCVFKNIVQDVYWLVFELSEESNTVEYLA